MFVLLFKSWSYMVHGTARLQSQWSILITTKTLWFECEECHMCLHHKPKQEFQRGWNFTLVIIFQSNGCKGIVNDRYIHNENEFACHLGLEGKYFFWCNLWVFWIIVWIVTSLEKGHWNVDRCIDTDRSHSFAVTSTEQACDVIRSKIWGQVLLDYATKLCHTDNSLFIVNHWLCNINISELWMTMICLFHHVVVWWLESNLFWHKLDLYTYMLIECKPKISTWTGEYKVRYII